ncbi:MAG: nucleotidyltransferase domain-containing protein [Elusimicrobiota bacterium]
MSNEKEKIISGGNNLTENEKQAVNELVEGLKNLYGDNLSRVILYGSKARGVSTEDSDIDIMIVLKDYKNWGSEFEKVAELVYSTEEKHDYDLLISFVIKKEINYHTEKSPLLLNIAKEGVNLWTI